MNRIDIDWFTDNLNVAAVAALAPPAEERCRTVFSVLAGGNPKLGGFGGRLERRLPSGEILGFSQRLQNPLS